jgi:hypothetical protein
LSSPKQELELTNQPESELLMMEERELLIEAAELFGATRIINEIANRFGAQTMRMLQRVRDNKVWRRYGYKSFDDLLDNHPQSPMTRHQFYEREKVLGLEGDTAFNALNALHIPISKRKLLAEGDVTIEGNCMKIGQQEFDLTDESSVALALGTLAMEYAKEKRKNERGTKELDVKKRRIGELEEERSHGGMAVDGTAHARALVVTLGDHAVLNQEIAKIEDEAERQRFGQEAMERLAQARLELEESLGFTAPAID